MAGPVKFGAQPGGAFNGAGSAKTKAKKSATVQARMRRNRRTGEVYQSGSGGGNYNSGHTAKDIPN